MDIEIIKRIERMYPNSQYDHSKPSPKKHIVKLVFKQGIKTIKLYAKTDVDSEREYKNLLRLQKLGIHKKLAIQKPVAYMKDKKTLITEKIPGVILSSQMNNIIPNLYKTGKWLGKFHNITEVGKKLDKYELLCNLRTNARKNLDGLTAKRLINEAEKRLPDNFDVTGVHGEFFPCNIILNDEMYVIDFSQFRFFSPYYDIATMHNFLRFTPRFLINKTKRDTAIREFLRGYESERKIEPDSLYFFNVYVLLNILNAANKIISSRSPIMEKMRAYKDRIVAHNIIASLIRYS